MAVKRERLVCGCKIRVAVYRGDKAWWNQGHVVVQPGCKRNHREDLEAMQKAMVK